jgi:hypothetical protein
MSLPKRPMIDAGFFILANRERPKDPRTEDHARALATLEQSGAEILIAAPALAEIFRKKYKTPPPATRWPVVAFGRAAASLLGRTMPNRWVTHPNVPGGYWKYDLMIAACAVIAQADAIMVADADYTGILAQMDPEGLVKIRRASDIVSMQVQFAFQPQPAEPSAGTAASTTASEVPATAATTEKADVTDASENKKTEQAKPVEAIPVASTTAIDAVAKAEAGTATAEVVAATPGATPVPPTEAASESPGGNRPVE